MLSFKQIKKILFFVQFIFMSSPFFIFAQQEQQKEYVQVVNMELILRVLKDGSPVGGLQKNDFSLYEDGEKTEINGFLENHRRIAPAEESQKQPHKPRLFLLFFLVGNPAADVEGVLNKFFSSIYREGDRVILATPLKTFELLSRQEIAKITAAFLEQWRQEAKNGASKKLQFYNDLQQLAKKLIAGIELEFSIPFQNMSSKSSNNISSFLSQYSAAIREYQLREFSPDMTAFEAVARSLLPIKNDKFALVFFQHDTLAMFDISKLKNKCLTSGMYLKNAKSMEDTMSKIEFQAKAAFSISSFSEQLKSLFVQANTQFHLLFLSPDKSLMQTDAASSTLSFIKDEDIISNWDQVMQELSKNTGGLMLDGNRMVDALDQIASFEDIYYHITYVPREHDAIKRKIDIRVNQPGMKVIYGRMLEMKELPHVKINEISATSQLIRLTVADFYSLSKEGIPTGLLNIYVSGKHADNEPSRLLLTQASETAGSVELPFAFPQLGAWNLQVRVIDQITGQQDEKSVKLEIAVAIPAATQESDSDPALLALLAKAAVYAEKLKKAAFHFVCQEEVTEDVYALRIVDNLLTNTSLQSLSRKDMNPDEFTPGDVVERLPKVIRNSWIYDYQIIGQDKKITENLVLLKKNRTKVCQEKAQFETMFRSFYSFYMPVTILAREKQCLYYYRLLGKEKVNKKKTWHIAAVRCDPLQPIPWGEIWVSEDDGAVLKIQIEQTSIIGFEELARKAMEKDLVIAITTIHEYNVEKNQIFFPSQTTFFERYNSKKDDSIVYERSRTYFEYKDYRFFSISTSVEEKSE